MGDRKRKAKSEEAAVSAALQDRAKANSVGLSQCCMMSGSSTLWRAEKGMTELLGVVCMVTHSNDCSRCVSNSEPHPSRLFIAPTCPVPLRAQRSNERIYRAPATPVAAPWWHAAFVATSQS